MDLLLIITLSLSTWALFVTLTEIGGKTKRSKSVRKPFDK